MTGPIPSVAPQRRERSPDFGSLAVRLVGRLRPERGRTAAVVALAVVGTAIAVILFAFCFVFSLIYQRYALRRDMAGALTRAVG